MPRLGIPLRRTALRRAKAPAAGGSRALLNAATSFTYDGFYELANSFGGGELFYGDGLTIRYVGGQQRFLMLVHVGNEEVPIFGLKEFTLPGSLGGTVDTDGTMWLDIWGNGFNGAACHFGLHWDESAGGLWSAEALDYPQGGIPNNAVSALSFRELNSNGTISNWDGWYGLEGVGQRALYGGIADVPTWFQTHAGVGPKVCGFGGYSSLLNQGLGPSLGPLFVFLNQNPRGNYTPSSDFANTVAPIPATDFVIGADCRSGTLEGDDWWTAANFATRTYDRGCRVSRDYDNWFDGSESRPNPPTRPTYPDDWTVAGGWWGAEISGKPDDDPAGYGRWSWGDSYFDTFNWIDNNAGTRPHHGIVLVYTGIKGYGHYLTSALAADAHTAEIHVYDPEHVKECIDGEREPFDVRPTSAWEIDFGGDTPVLGGGPGFPPQKLAAAKFDPVAGKLYILGRGVNGTAGRLYQLSVAA